MRHHITNKYCTRQIHFTKYIIQYNTTIQITIKTISQINNKRIFFRLSEIWNIFSRNMIKFHIFSRAGKASENMWHVIMLSENVYHISRKTKK
jgi:hypothetical protein